MTGYNSKRQMSQNKLNDDDDTQVYADTLLIVYQRGYADGKQAAQRKPLTDEEITELDMEISGRTMDECVRAIEAKLKAKNDH